MDNTANLVPPYCPDGNMHGVSAALEYSVNALKVQHVVVMGHGKCGGVCACLAGDSLDENVSEFVRPWVGMLNEAKVSLSEEKLHVGVGSSIMGGGG